MAVAIFAVDVVGGHASYEEAYAVLGAPKP
jgi:hypothetical protein